MDSTTEELTELATPTTPDALSAAAQAPLSEAELSGVDAFWRASILKEYFGKDFVDTYCTLKEVEADRFYAEPTTRDFEWYLRTV